MGIAVIQAWRNKNAHPEKGQGPRSRARNSGPKSKVRGSQVTKTWAALDLDESLASSSSSSRAPGQQRPRWQALDLDDAVDPGEAQSDTGLGDTVAPVGVNPPAARRTKTWRSLDLDDSDDPPKPEQSHRWQSLSFDDQ